MVRIREILALDPLAGFELLAGAGGLDNVLTNVTILDYETDSMDFSAFQKGDFILTSLFFAKDAPQLIVDAFRELLRRGIAGIAVKTVFYKTLPADMLRLADAMNVPVFAYHAASMEEIILAAHSYMLAKEQRELAAMRLDAMLGFGRAPSAVAESVRALDAMLYPHCVASFSTPREGGALNLGQKMPSPCFQMGNIPHFSLIMTGFCSFIPQRMQSALQARKMRCFAHMNHAAWRLPHGGPGFPPRAMHTIFSMQPSGKACIQTAFANVLKSRACAMAHWAFTAFFPPFWRIKACSQNIALR